MRLFPSQPVGRRAMTLVELVVAITIVVALAALVLPMFPNVVERSHASSGGENMREIAKSIQLYSQLYGKQPDYYDSLLMPWGTDFAIFSRPQTMMIAREMDTRTGDALAAAGILHTCKMAASTWPDDEPVEESSGGEAPGPVPTTNNATMSPYPSLFTRGVDGDLPRLVRSLLPIGLSMPLGAVIHFLPLIVGQSGTEDPLYFNIQGGASPSGYVAWLSDDGVAALGLEPVDPSGEPHAGKPFRYVVFGFGTKCTAIGKTSVEAPLHFSGVSPVKRYSRFLVVYEIPGVGPARLAAVAAMDKQQMAGITTHISEYYQH